MIGLADCNNFFVSCERVFRPELMGRPVIVLSNNDGCAVALSNEAKQLGFKRGDPYFKIRARADAQGVYVFSGNHRLYGDMSARVMSTLRYFCDELEIYSIDEAFFYVADNIGALDDFGRYVRHTVARNIGIPVSIGFAPTKTLAKIAVRFAKKYPAYRGACVIDSVEKAEKAMSLTPVEDVWGVGRRNAPKLRRCRVETALDLARMNRDHVSDLFGIVGVRMWRELNGEACIDSEIVPPQRKTLTCSTSFQTDVYDEETLRNAVASYAATVARRLRSKGLLAEAVEVYVATNRFHTSQPQYYNAYELRLEDPTADTAMIVRAAQQSLARVYRKGYGFKKAGVTITHCVPADAAVHSLFADPVENERRRRLMEAMDRINSMTVGGNVMRPASTGSGLTAMTRREHASRLFTQRLDDIITVRV